MKNKLTLFLDEIHAFVGLQCDAGFYPSCKDETNGAHQKHMAILQQEKIEQKKNNQDEEHQKYLRFLQKARERIFKNRPIYEILEIQAPQTQIIPMPISTPSSLPRKTFMGHSLPIKFHELYRYDYCVSHEGPEDGHFPSGIYFKNHAPYDNVTLRNAIPHISYDISAEGARFVFTKIKYLAENQPRAYAYNLFLHNCLHVGKELYQEAGLGEGQLFSVVYKDLPRDYTSVKDLYMLMHDTLTQTSIFIDIFAALLLFRFIKNYLVFKFIKPLAQNTETSSLHFFVNVLPHPEDPPCEIKKNRCAIL